MDAYFNSLMSHRDTIGISKNKNYNKKLPLYIIKEKIEADPRNYDEFSEYQKPAFKFKYYKKQIMLNTDIRSLKKKYSQL